MLAREGYPYIIVPTIAGLVLLFTGYWLLALLPLVLAFFMAYFFRDPQRIVPTDADVIVSPADGRVTRVSALVTLSKDEEFSPTLVSIFLSPLDVHINRAPIAGRISDVTFTRGRFLMATKEESSLVNEQNALTIEGAKVTIVCKQIAGVLARRIVCWKKAGDEVALGERFGLIKFSSRTDLVLPPEIEVLVHEGMRVKGGVTIIGRMRR